MTVVVCTGGTAGVWQVPASFFGSRPRVTGGERTLYELATALAVAGVEVELRGNLAEPVFRAITGAAGAAPMVNLPARAPTADDVVVLPEGGTAIALYATVALSPARGVIMVLGPPGQYGWNFVDPHHRPLDLLTFPVDAVGRPEHFRAMADLGFALWSNSPGLAAASESAGVPCLSLGTGNPEGFPELVARTHDLAVVTDNRWIPLARQVVDALPDVSCLEIGDQGHRTLATELGRARILVWPSRIEGDSRIQREARAMGTVPVALRSNRFAAGLDDQGGAVVVDTVTEMPGAIRRLLGDPTDLATRSARAAATSREWAQWPRYVERVRAALASLPPAAPGQAARAAIGAELARHEHTGPTERAHELEARVRQGLLERVQELEALVQAYRGRRMVRMVDRWHKPREPNPREQAGP